TPTRASGLLLGAAAAFVWRPWRRRQEVSAESARRLDVVAALGIVVLIAAFAFAHLPESYVYGWLLPLVTVASLALTAIVVVPASTRIGRVMSWRPLVAIGRRSYGLYLWHWPIFVIAGGTGGSDASVARVTMAIVATVVVSEPCYRYVETPVRTGALGRWWRAADRRRPLALGTCAFLVVALGAFYRNLQTFDAAQGGRETQFSLPAAPSPQAPTPQPTPPVATGDVATTADTPSSEVAPWTNVPQTDATRPVTTAAAPPELPVDVGIVGDSQAHALAVNLPSGIESTFAVNDGSMDGCSIYESGNVVSSRDFRNDFGMCANWRQAWAEAAAGNDVVLVVLGAWDVFDLEIDGQTLTFASPEWDAAFTSRLQSGIDAINDSGATAALLEVPCMRPIDVEGAGVPALPERGDDARVAHVNDLMRQLAAEQPSRAGFVAGPMQWCNGSPEATDTAYRWDGVHVYVPGANLIFETIAPSLLALA
ncbi:MAG: acyltransferase family protein, partial [Ilumatobacteraceae bacterium]